MASIDMIPNTSQDNNNSYMVGKCVLDVI